MNSSATVDAAKSSAADHVEREAQRMADVSAAIHARPELLFEERFAADLLARELESSGFEVERQAFGLETAFAARFNPEGEGPLVAVICEYDALPGIGHGCGHNLIAAAGLGAGLGAASVARELDGRLVVLGTPAEEGGGGKILMADRGAFEGVAAAMMVHPADHDLIEADVIAIATWRVEYRGRGAHAAAAPEQGRNALDAAVLGYMGVSALRQHIGGRERVHGVFLEAGEKPNIVPDHTVAEWYVRSPTIEALQDLKGRVMACLEAGASAAGCTMEWRPTCPEYSHLATDPALAASYRSNSERIGRPVSDPDATRRVTASTDMGNVSLLVPSIHPMVAVAPAGVALHTAEFARWAASAEGQRGAVDGAKAMAMTVADVWAGETRIRAPGQPGS